MIKRILLLCFLGLSLGVAQLFADDDVPNSKHEISVSLGFHPIGVNPDPRVNIYRSAGSASDFKVSFTALPGTQMVGPMTFSYMINCGQGLFLGVSYSYGILRNEIGNNASGSFGGSSYNETTHTDYKNRDAMGYTRTICHQVMLTAKYEWFRRGKLRLYSKFGIGFFSCAHPGITTYSYTHKYEPELGKDANGLAIQFAPASVSYRVFPHVSLFAEVGYQTIGIANLGFTVHL